MPSRPPNALRKAMKPSRAQAVRKVEERRGSATARGYGPKWRASSASHLSRSPLCLYCRLGDYPKITPATLVDHLYPHKQDWVLFWRTCWWVSSCKTCHDGWKARLEHQGADALDDLARQLGLPVRPRG